MSRYERRAKSKKQFVARADRSLHFVEVLTKYETLIIIQIVGRKLENKYRSAYQLWKFLNESLFSRE